MRNKFKIKKINNVKFYQILNYKLNMMNISSIIHRITGLIIFINIPFLLYFLEYSVKSQKNFNKIFNILIIKIFLYFIIFIYLYHILSGIKYLILDIFIKNYEKNMKIFSIIIFIIMLLFYIYINIIF